MYFYDQNSAIETLLKNGNFSRRKITRRQCDSRDTVDRIAKLLQENLPQLRKPKLFIYLEIQLLKRNVEDTQRNNQNFHDVAISCIQRNPKRMKGTLTKY